MDGSILLLVLHHLNDLLNLFDHLIQLRGSRGLHATRLGRALVDALSGVFVRHGFAVNHFLDQNNAFIQIIVDFPFFEYLSNLDIYCRRAE